MLFPVDTIITKFREHDYNFFLNQKNFYKVTDTLEKFEEHLDLENEEARHFVTFKRRLYEMYEVRHRSLKEHESFSFQFRRENLTHLYERSHL